MKKLLLVILTVMPIACAPHQAQNFASLEDALANASGRPDADKSRDAGRKPVEVLNFLGIESGKP